MAYDHEHFVLLKFLSKTILEAHDVQWIFIPTRSQESYHCSDRLGEAGVHNERLEDDVDQEVRVVPETDTVVDPWTVMIESFDTVTAYLAVSAATRSDCAVIRAQLRTVNDVEHVFEVYIFVLEVAWISARTQREEKQAHHVEE